MADEYEDELERRLQALDEQTDAVSKAIEPESTEKPEVDVPDVPADPDGDSADGAESKADEGDAPSKNPDPDDDEDHPVVPIARLSEATRKARALERDNREKDDKIAELTAKLDSLLEQAQTRGVEISDTPAGFTDTDFESLKDEFGESHARTLINMQKQLNAVNELVAKQKPVAPEDDPLMDAIVENDDAHGWFLTAGKNWKAMKAAWAEHEAELMRDFDTDAARIEHVVQIVKGKGKPPAQPAEKAGPKRSLGNVPGESGTYGGLVDQYLAMGDRAVGKLAQLEQTDPVAYEQVLEALREHRLKK